MKMVLLTIIILIFTTTQTMAQIQVSAEVEKYISQILNKKTPYRVKVLDYDFIINSVHAYPPGELTAMFASYLIDKNLIKGKVIADIGCGCFALGIISAKNGASTIIGTDINDYAIKCAQDNLALNTIKQKTYLYKGEGFDPLLKSFSGKIDIIISGAPWDSISTSEFQHIGHERKPISRSFYDVDDKLITSIMLQGFDLLAPGGKIFITSSMRALDRVKQLCLKHKIKYKIVKEADLHNDGNIHYILELIA